MVGWLGGGDEDVRGSPTCDVYIIVAFLIDYPDSFSPKSVTDLYATNAFG